MKIKQTTKYCERMGKESSEIIFKEKKNLGGPKIHKYSIKDTNSSWSHRYR